MNRQHVPPQSTQPRRRLTATIGILLFASTLACQVPATGASLANDGKTTWILVVADRLPAPVRSKLKASLTSLLVDRAPAGDELHVFVGAGHQPLAHIVTPSSVGKRRLRDAAFVSELRKTCEWLDQSMEGSSQFNAPMLPSTVDSVFDGQGSLRIVLVGDPIYDHPENDFWSMRDNAYHSDFSVIDDRSTSPFFNQTGKRIPENTEIVFLTPNANWGDSKRHRDRVIRFYRLAFQRQLGGRLTRITTDSAAAFRPVMESGLTHPVEPENNPFVGVWRIQRLTIGSEYQAPVVVPTANEQAAVSEDAEVVPAQAISPIQSTPVPPVSTLPTPTAPASTTPETSPSPLSVPEPVPPSPPTTADRTTAATTSRNTTLRPSPLSPVPPQTGQPAAQRSAWVAEATQGIRQALEAGLNELARRESPAPDATVPPRVAEAKGDVPRHDEEPPGHDVARRGAAPSGASLHPVPQPPPAPSPTQPDQVVLTWDSRCPHADLDLWITDPDAGETLYNEHPATSFGRLHRNLKRGSAKGNAAAETTETATLQADRTSQLDIWVNAFHTHQPVTATITLVKANGERAEVQFYLAGPGDFGRGSQTRSDSQAWHQVDLAALNQSLSHLSGVHHE